jgi:hypothetical protein
VEIQLGGPAASDLAALILSSMSIQKITGCRK